MMAFLHRWTVLTALLLCSIKCYVQAAPEVAVYWGQNSAYATFPTDQSRWEKNLAHYCQSGSYNIINLSFLNGFPSLLLNFANHCSTTFDGSTLLQCPDIAADIVTCQSLGVKIFLSLGGASGSYGFSSDSDGTAFAEVLYNTFLGGSAAQRPFGTAVLDGFDLDIEGGNSAGYAAMINALRQTWFPKDSKTYYISGAPQCPYPDAYLGPQGSSALQIAAFDYIFVQFCIPFSALTHGLNVSLNAETDNNYCGVSAPSSFNLDTWTTFASTAPNTNLKVLIGVPGSADAGNGYISAADVVSLASQYSSNPNYGGVMIWETSTAEANNNFGQAIAQGIGAKAPSSGNTDNSTPSSGHTDTSVPSSGSASHGTDASSPSSGHTDTSSPSSGSASHGTDASSHQGSASSAPHSQSGSQDESQDESESDASYSQDSESHSGSHQDSNSDWQDVSESGSNDETSESDSEEEATVTLDVTSTMYSTTTAFTTVNMAATPMPSLSTGTQNVRKKLNFTTLMYPPPAQLRVADTPGPAPRPPQPFEDMQRPELPQRGVWTLNANKSGARDVRVFTSLPSSVSSEAYCADKSIGYYCNADQTTYQWCYAQDQAPVQGSCSSGLVCSCGYATKPCTPTYQIAEGCEASSGDFSVQQVMQPFTSTHDVMLAATEEEGEVTIQGVHTKKADKKSGRKNFASHRSKQSQTIKTMSIRQLTQVKAATVVGTAAKQECPISFVDTFSAEDRSDVMSVANATFSMPSSNHMYPALTLDLSKLNVELNAIIDSRIFDDWQLYAPKLYRSNSTFSCPVHPPKELYLTNPTQMLVGRPAVTVTKNGRTGVLRIPDKQFALFLAYLMDDYGLNPEWVLSIVATQSGLSVVDQARDDGLFIINDWKEELTCEESEKVEGGWCKDTARGAFDTNQQTLITDAAIFAQRFDIGDSLDNLIENYTTSSHLSMISFGLDTLWKRTSLWRLPNLGFRKAMQGASERMQDELEFATMTDAVTSDFPGKISKRLCDCGASTLRDLKALEACTSQSAKLTFTKTACETFANAPSVYDFPVTWQDIDQFLNKLKDTFAEPQHALNWTEIRTVTARTYSKLYTLRHAKGGADFAEGGISYRYDWRTVLAVIRAGLPKREDMIGALWEKWVTVITGNSIADDLAPYTSSFHELAFVAPAGSRSTPGTLTASALNALYVSRESAFQPVKLSKVTTVTSNKEATAHHVQVAATA